MRPSRGMGAIRPELKKRRDNTDFLEGGRRHPRRDNTDFTDFTEYAEGGQVYAEGGSVNDMITGLIATIGENMALRRAAYLEVPSGTVVSYVHAQVGEGLGRIAVLVALESEKTGDALEAFANQLAQHVAAAAPIALSDSDIPADRLERERAVALEQVKGDPKLEGKPQQVLDGAVNGKVRKILEDLVLLKQKFIHDDKLTVEQAVKAAEKSVGGPISLKGFVRFQLGEGVEKKAEDFAAEVAATIGKS